jgi:hypothetical protein
MALTWGTIGVGQGASFGALAMIPVPVLGSVAAIGLNMIAKQALTGATEGRRRSVAVHELRPNRAHSATYDVLRRRQAAKGRSV